MQKLTFVIGANAAGKTYFIEHHLANEKAVALNIYDYQQKVFRILRRDLAQSLRWSMMKLYFGWMI